MRFKDKSVIITGGGGKIGKAYAVAFAKEGAKVSLPDIASADHVVKAVTDIGGSATVAPSLANPIAYALPILPPPPVMMTDLPAKRIKFSFTLVQVSLNTRS